ncbi:DMT family transporter [Corynebacterium sp.]|uniref:EamA family transporter n=1 Tax=Corynebacterium sp. TaxID=1720 RepID=UPI0026DF1B26|nr:EamA family transporter [Corynebacterium sp.]MDO5511232.1 EamA family transporter [Corynebacterium sp.]
MNLRAPAVMIASGVSLYAGAAVAVGLFDVLPPAIVAWFRISAAAVILLALVRPRLADFRSVPALIYGLATMGMNMAFYESIARLPLGTAVAVEFLGPVLVAAVGSRSIRDWLALALATSGVVVISGAVWSTAAVGLGFALLAGGLWAVYILVGSRIAVSSPRKSMTTGFTMAAVLALPLVVWGWPEHVETPATMLLGLALGLGVLSAVIPYSLDQVVMRMAGSSYFALLQALLPVVAAVLGAVALGQWLSLPEVVGIVLVVAAVALRRP